MGVSVRRLTFAAFAALAASWGVAAAPVQRVNVQMKEFAFVPATVSLKAGVSTVVVLSNRGVVEHEFMVYGAGGLHMAGMGHDERHRQLEARSYFRGVAVQVEGKAPKVERMGKDLVMLNLAPGQQVVLRFVPRKRGTFEMGCHLPGHYEAGMKGTWVVR